MRFLKYFSISIFALLVSFSANAQVVSSNLIEKAKSMSGASEYEIQQMLKGQGQLSTTQQPQQGGDVIIMPGSSDRQLPQINNNRRPFREVDELDTIKVFGRNLFRVDTITYEPNLNIPTPRDYILSIGDEIIITIWGDSQLLYKEKISPEGLINVPNYGPVSLSGMSIVKAQEKLQNILSRLYDSLGTTSQLMLSIGQIGSIKVNVAGESTTPGTYTIPSLATLFHVLNASGGTNRLGDLRNIEVYRDSKLLVSMDIYKYIISGDMSNNIILKDNDVILIKPYKARVAVEGLVKRPMSYFMKADETLANLIEYSGGFESAAYTGGVKLYRNNGENLEILSVKRENFATTKLEDGDRFVVEQANNEYKNIVTIDGAVWRPGDFQLSDEISTLSDIIESAGGLRGDAFSHRGIITRRNADYTKSVINFNTVEIATGAKDIPLINYDVVFIPAIDSLREARTINIAGEVNNTTELAYMDNMRLEDVIILAGGFKESASLANIDVVRRIKNPMSMEYSKESSKTISLRVNEDLSLSESTKNFVIEPFDQIYIRRSPQYKQQYKINIMGEVLFPGQYTLTNTRTYLSDVINMARGLTPGAYLKGTSLTRRRIQPKIYDGDETNNTEFFTADDISNMALNNLNNSLTDRDSLALNSFYTTYYSVGVDIEAALANPHGPDDVLLNENDIVLIPKVNNTVNVIGSVYYPNSTSFSTKKMKHYISEGGGYNKKAIKRPFVIYPNGKVKSTKSFIFRSYPKVEQGCLVVVPTKSDKDRATFAETMSLLTGLTSVATSLGTLGVAIL